MQSAKTHFHPGIDRNTYTYLKQLERTRARQRRRERAWLIGGCIGAAALVALIGISTIYATGAW
jgi:hypothetical protein